MTRKIEYGRWICINNFDDWKKYYQEVRVKKGYHNYDGPGKYYLLEYSQKCPRGCCYDDVVEILQPEQIIEEIKREMLDLSLLLKDAKRVLI